MVAAVEHILQTTMGIADIEVIHEDTPIRGDVLHQLTVMGEAAKHVPQEVRDEWPEVAWADIAGLRDRIVHYCFGLSDDVLLHTVRVDLPRDLALLRALLAQLHRPTA
jgi:uncharacterized protein with HEPN domain